MVMNLRLLAKVENIHHIQPKGGAKQTWSCEFLYNSHSYANILQDKNSIIEIKIT